MKTNTIIALGLGVAAVLYFTRKKDNALERAAAAQRIIDATRRIPTGRPVESGQSLEIDPNGQSFVQ